MPDTANTRYATLALSHDEAALLLHATRAYVAHLEPLADADEYGVDSLLAQRLEQYQALAAFLTNVCTITR